MPLSNPGMSQRAFTVMVGLVSVAATTAAAVAATAAGATATAAATAAVTAAATTATGAFFTRPGFVDDQGAALELLAIQLLNGLIAAVGHFHEAEASRPARLSIH